ncbi:MAG: hypothetical protein RBT49_17565 [Bacteroidales bacterium]|jgi:hypothetical protein|nr:hypothetical protein [Bacteroidales bacterium]
MKLKIKSLYLKGIVLNFTLALFFWFFKIEIFEGGENFLGGFYLLLFFLSFLFYLPYLGFSKKDNQIKNKKRYIISLTPTLLYLLTIVCFLIYLDQLVKLLAFIPCIVLNLLYSLIVESLVANSSD